MPRTRTLLVALAAAATLVGAPACSDDDGDDAGGAEQADGAEEAGGTGGGEATLTLDGEELEVTDVTCVLDDPDAGDVRLSGTLPDGGSVSVSFASAPENAATNAFDVRHQEVDRSLFLSQTQATLGVSVEGDEVDVTATVGSYEDGDPANDIVEEDVELQATC